MYIRMLETRSTPNGLLRRDRIYEVDDERGTALVRRGLAVPSDVPPPHVQAMLARLEPQGEIPHVFLPFVGEFGHCVMTHLRIVHFHKAFTKIVCCRPGDEVLFSSAFRHITDWTDPVPDAQKIGSHRRNPPKWDDIRARFPGYAFVAAGGLTPAQELHCIKPQTRIPFNPRQRGLSSDVVLGVRHRELFPERNWPHWQSLANAISDAGLTFSVVGRRPTTLDLVGQQHHSGDFDTDATIELLQNCRLYIGTDTGISHLAATVGCPMLVFRETASGSRDLFPRMAQVNARLSVIANGWTRPDVVKKHCLESIGV